MHFANIAIAALAITAKAITVSYDTGYDIEARSLDRVACSNGVNGLTTIHGWKTQGEIPSFPHIGGAEAVAQWDSPSCGTCWKLEYGGKSITVLAIDHAAKGFNLALAAMDDLINGLSTQLGRVEAKATKVDVRECGI